MNAVVQHAPTAGESAFNLAQRQAMAMCNSTLVPAQYRGKENLGNVLIAMEMANRIGATPLQMMQSLHVIQGRPSLSSSFLIATVNACGRFEPLRFEIEGEDPDKEDYRVRAYAADKKTGAVCLGAWITWKMVKAEGWSKKPGSKWMTMAGQMFLYRAAAFWARVYAPEVSMGIHTVEEVQDVWGTATVIPNAPTDHSNLKQLESDLTGNKQEPPPGTDTTTGELVIDAETLRKSIAAAADIDALDDLATYIGELDSDSERAELTALYNDRRTELEQ